MSYRIYAYPNNIGANKSLIAANFGNIKIDYPSDFKMGTDNKSEHYLKTINPTGQVPALQTPDGPIWESNAMALYVARKVGEKLYPTDAYKQSLIDQWMLFTVNNLEKYAFPWFGALRGYGEYHKEAVEGARKSYLEKVQIVEHHLESHKYVLGDSISIIDIIFFVNLSSFGSMALDPTNQKNSQKLLIILLIWEKFLNSKIGQSNFQNMRSQNLQKNKWRSFH